MNSNLNASFIVPTSNSNLIKRLRHNLDKNFSNFELIPVTSAKSANEVWQIGLKQARKKYLIYTHQDVRFYSFPNLNAVFSNPKVGLVGPAGSKIINREKPWWFDPGRLEQGLLSGTVLHISENNTLFESYYGDYGKVVVLDDVCLVSPKSILQNISLPNHDWLSWDIYDHPLSLEFHKQGYTLKTIPIKLVHRSTKFERPTQFAQSLQRFTKEYFKDRPEYSV